MAWNVGWSWSAEGVPIAVAVVVVPRLVLVDAGRFGLLD
jgi:hypothetical protein